MIAIKSKFLTNPGTMSKILEIIESKRLNRNAVMSPKTVLKIIKFI
jgi:hypothetical protein